MESLFAGKPLPTTDALITCRLTTYAVRKLLAQNKFVTLGRGFHVDPNLLPTQEWDRDEELYRLQCRAAKVFYKDSVICYESAARLWGLYSWFDEPDIHIALPGVDNAHYHVKTLPESQEFGVKQTRVKRHQMHFLPGDVINHGLDQVTSLHRTLIDVAARSHPLHGYVMVCAGLRKILSPQPGEPTRILLARQKLIRTKLLAHLDKVHQHRRLRGYRWAKRIITYASGLCESPLEAAFSWHWLANGYPSFKRQHEFGFKKHAPFRADVYLPDKKLIIELDGMGKLKTGADVQSMREREQIIAWLGYRLLRLTSAQVASGHLVIKAAAEITGHNPRHIRYLWARTRNLALNQLKVLRRRP